MGVAVPDIISTITAPALVAMRQHKCQKIAWFSITQLINLNISVPMVLIGRHWQISIFATQNSYINSVKMDTLQT